MATSTTALVAAREVKEIGGDIARCTKQAIEQANKFGDNLCREYLITDIREMRKALDCIEVELGIRQTGLGS